MRDWARATFGACDLGDARRSRRVARVVARFAARPQGTTTTVFPTRKEQVGFGRLLHNPALRPAAVLWATAADTFTHVPPAAHYVVAAHDTVTYNLARWRHARGLGRINNRAHRARGVLLHDTVLATPDGRFLGLAAAHLWRRPARWVESTKWVRGVRAVTRAARAAGCTVRLRHVMDREADHTDLLTFAVAHDHHLVVRARVDRALVPATPDAPRKLWAALQAAPLAATETFALAARRGRPAREVTVEVRVAPVTLASKRARGLRLWAVYVREPAPPRGVAALEWMLLCTFPVATATEACAVRRDYGARWRNEDLHKVTKTGLRAERRWIDDVDGAKRLLALLLPAGSWLLRLTYDARTPTPAPADQFVDDDELRALKALARQHGVRLPRRAWTSHDVVGVLARAGGYQPRKNGHPGWQVLWRGWQKFRDFYEGWVAAHAVNLAPD